MSEFDFSELSANATSAAAYLKAMANPSRLMILCTLIEGEASVNELNEAVPLSQSALSQHLASLRQKGLVSTRRESQTIYYRLEGDGAIKIISALKEIFCK